MLDDQNAVITELPEPFYLTIPIMALYYESENELKFYNLEARLKTVRLAGR